MTDTFDQEVRDVAGAVAGLDSKGGRHELVQEFPLYTVDSFRTCFGEDTFTDHWRTHKPVLAWMHNLREPIGRAVDTRVVTQTQRGERVKVAQVRSRFSRFSAVPLAERAYTQIADGDLTDCSFGFNEFAPRRPWSAQGVRGVELVTRARMNETSPVTIGSIPGARITGIREQGGAGLAVPTFSEEELAALVGERFVAVERQLEQVSAIFADRLGTELTDDEWEAGLRSVGL